MVNPRMQASSRSHPGMTLMPSVVCLPWRHVHMLIHACGEGRNVQNSSRMKRPTLSAVPPLPSSTWQCISSPQLHMCPFVHQASWVHWTG